MASLSLSVVVMTQHQAVPASTPVAEVAVRQADEAWAKAVASKSVELTVGLYDTEAVMAGSAMMPARGIAAVRTMWVKAFAEPDFFLRWKADKAVVTESGTIAYSNGTWRMAGPNATGPCLAAWRRQADGQWSGYRRSVVL